MKRYIIVLGVLLYSVHVFPQEKFGVAVQCGGQADFAGLANCGSTFGVAGLGVMRSGVLEFSLGVGYSYKLCSNDQSEITGFSQTGFIWENWRTFHRMHFLNVPFAISVRCWQRNKFQLKVWNNLEYNLLCEHVEYVKDNRQTITIEKGKDIPREARNGLTYRIGLSASYAVSEHCILNVMPFFGVKAILNQYEPYPSHPPHEENSGHTLLPDHRFSSGVIIGVEYCF